MLLSIIITTTAVIVLFIMFFNSKRRQRPTSIIILGGTMGLGAALALEFRKRFQSIQIYCVARHINRCPIDNGITYVQADVREASKWNLDLMFPDTNDAWVINCAGMARCSLFCDIGDIAQTTGQMIDINLNGTIHSAWAMLRNSERKYIMVSSVVAHLAIPGYAVYRTSKYALRGFYESLCAEGLSNRVGIVYANTMLTPGYNAEELAGKPPVTKRLESFDTPTKPHIAASHIINHMLTHGPHGVMMTSNDFVNWICCSSTIDIVPVVGWLKRCCLVVAEWIVFPRMSIYGP